MPGSSIVSVTAREVFSDRGHPGIETTVTTQNGARGVAVVTAGVSVGTHEVQFAYDGGPKWRGKGVLKAVDNVVNVIGPAVKGMDASRQLEVDDAIIKLDGTPNKARLGGNATASVSAAVLKAGAASLGVPLYYHIGGVNACTLPVPGIGVLGGSKRYGGGACSGGKPSHALMAFGFNTFAEAAYAAWDVADVYNRLVASRLGLEVHNGYVPAGVVKHDRELWDLMVEAIQQAGYEGKIGIQVDVAAATYYEKDTERFVGLFSAEDKTRDDLFELYQYMVRNYPFVIIEDPLDEDDYDGHADLTRLLGVQIVGDDLFTTDPARVRYGIAHGAGNCVLLKVNQIGTISEAFEMVRLAHQNNYAVMPCSSRGEGADIADYTVGLMTGQLREGATGPTGNRLMEIEAELGSRAQFLGRKALKLKS